MEDQRIHVEKVFGFQMIDHSDPDTPLGEITFTEPTPSTVMDRVREHAPLVLSFIALPFLFALSPKAAGSFLTTFVITLAMSRR